MRKVPTTIAILAALAIPAAFGKVGDGEPLAAVTTAVETKEFDRALELAKELGENDPPPKDLADVVMRAGAACVGDMQIEAAAGFFRLLLDKSPDSDHAATARAELLGCYNHLRQLDDCISQAKVNLELDPESRWVEYWTFILAQSHFKLWKFAEARSMLEEFLASYPDGDYASHARKCLGKIDPPWEIGDNGLVRYSGKFHQDIRVKANLKTLPDDKEAGFRMLEDRLGLDLRPHTNVVILLQDSGPRTTPGLKASTYVVGRNGVPTIVMRFYSEFVASRPEDYRQTLTHELKHAGFKGIMGQGYENLPNWIREGLAVWGTDDVETRLQLVLCNKIAGGKDPLSVLDGIDDGDHSEADYMEDALAFEWLEGKKAGNVKAFCRELVKGRPYREIWEELSGMDYKAAMNEANVHCRNRVETALGQGLGEFIAIRGQHEEALNAGEAATKKWLQEGGRDRLETWLTKNAGHPAEPMARFCLARSLARSGEGEAARKILRHILENDGFRCTLLDDAQFWIGVSYNWEKEFDNAREAFGVLLRDFPVSHNSKQVAGKFPPAGPVTE